MLSIVKLYLDIALLRREPSDLPASPLLLGMTVAACVVLKFLLAQVFRQDLENALAQLLVAAGASLAGYWITLRLFARSERFLQTATAAFGVACLLAPLAAPLDGALSANIRDPESAGPYALLAIPLVGYAIFINARILRAAIERPMAQAVGIFLMIEIFGFLCLLLVFAQLEPAAG